MLGINLKKIQPVPPSLGLVINNPWRNRFKGCVTFLKPHVPTSRNTEIAFLLDPDVLNGSKPPTCWDRGWNTHTHYLSYTSNILAVNQERWRGGTNIQANYHGVKFYDISDRARPKFLSGWEAPVSDPVGGRYPDAGGAHHFNFDADGHYLYLGTEYKGFIGKILVILDVRDPQHPKEAGKWWLPGQKTPEEDAIRNWIQQGHFNNPIQIVSGKYTKHVGMHYVTTNGDRAYLSYHQAGLVILDISNKNKPRFISRLDYLVPGFVDPTNRQGPAPPGRPGVRRFRHL